MSPIRTLLAAVVVLVMVATPIGAAAATSTGQAAGPKLLSPTAGEISQAMGPVSTHDLLGQLQLRLMRSFGGSFGGLFVNGAGVLTVATDGPASASLMGAAESAVAGLRGEAGLHSGGPSQGLVAFRNTGASLTHLFALKAAILYNPALRALGVDGAGLDIERGRVVVFSSTPLGASEVRNAYGDKVETLVDRTSTLDDNRFNDSAPFNGGDQIVTPSGGETTCTSGFGLQDTSTGTNYLLTAGHCGSATWYN
ncbi:MAG TPA: hypothetical protein VGP46_01105, partial [Acidimicrobiales bacterium]|nr:hypothetical protein [Acidimicrobiales bacterium]